MQIGSFEDAPQVTDTPSCIKLVGEGSIAYGPHAVPVSITLMMIPGQSIALECECDEDALPPDFRTDLGDLDSYSVSGVLDGHEFVCKILYCTESTHRWMQSGQDHWRGVFLPFAPIQFDYPTQEENLSAKSMTCALMTYTGPGFHYSIDGLEFSGRVSRHIGDCKKLARTWNAPVETATLTITATEPLPVERLKDITDDFLLLLSFSQGEQISYFRSEFLFPDDQISEVWQSRRVWSPMLLSRPVPVPQDQFLPIAYSNYAGWLDEKRQLVRLSIYYHLDAKHANLLEIVTISEAIMWEMMVREIEKAQPVTDEVKALKKRIKQMYREWHKDYPAVENAERLHMRLHESLKWMPLREGIKQMVTSLKLGALPADPLVLKTFRDSIAHTGRFPDEFSDMQSVSDTLGDLVSLGDQILLAILR